MSEPHHWTPEQDAMLGTRSDRALGELLDVPSTQVRRRRELLGKPSTRSQKWTPEMVACFGVLTDAQIVDKFHLGVMPDAVRAQRLKRKILCSDKQRRKIVWTDAYLAMLGVTPDEEVAEAMGIHKDTVAAKRRMIGLAKFERR